MKCEQAEQAILLKDSGELGALARYQLNRHVAGCPACQSFQTDLGTTRSALHALPAPSLSDRTRTSILAAATPDRREVVTLAPTLRPVTWWRPAFAAAALIALLAASLYLRSGANSTAPSIAQKTPAAATTETTLDEAVDAEMDALQQLLVASLDEPTVTPTETDNTDNLDEETLARELLALQETTL